ncbi:MAG: type II toxin-antitoxin system VapC family toxin [Actinomycetales bacterium]
MNAFVLDTSLALEWFTTTASSQVLAKRSLFDNRVAIVPHLWRFEVMNVMATWQRRRIITRAQAVFLLDEILALPFAVIDDGSQEAIVNLAVDQGLSSYDATYLHIAMVSGQPLATLDHGLIKAADDVGVPCL